MKRFELTQKIEKNILILTLKGQLDALTADRLQSVVAFLKDSDISYVVMDFSGIKLVDSSGIGAMISIYKLTRAAGGDTVLTNVGQQPMEVFKILNLPKAICMYDSVENAVDDFSEREPSSIMEDEPSSSDSRTDLPRPSSIYTA